MASPPTTLLIACGALAWEITELIRAHGWTQMSITCLPAHLHNRPEKIPDGVREKIRAARGRYDNILVVYGDCGTGGMLDAVLAEEGVERIAGPHCYQFYAGTRNFEALMDDEPGSFFLTDPAGRPNSATSRRSSSASSIPNGASCDRPPALDSPTLRADSSSSTGRTTRASLVAAATNGAR